MAGNQDVRAAAPEDVAAPVVTLGLFALLAARRTNLAWWKRALIVAALVGLGAVVVLLKTLAH